MMNTTENQNTHDHDLLELKSQYQTFKSAIESQPVINSKIIQRVIKSGVSSVNHIIHSYTIVGLIGILLWILIGVFFKLSILFIIATCIMMSADMACDHWSAWPLKKISAPDTTMIQASVLARRSRARFTISTCLGIMVIIPWFCWFAYELTNSAVCNIDMGQGFTNLIVILSAIGGLIGLSIGIILVVRMRKKLASIDAQIHKFINMNDSSVS